MELDRKGKAVIILNEQEMSLIKKLREISYGRVTIYIENSIPVRIEEIRESIKL